MNKYQGLCVVVTGTDGTDVQVVQWTRSEEAGVMECQRWVRNGWCGRASVVQDGLLTLAMVDGTGTYRLA